MFLKGREKTFHFLSICILAFINEGTSSLSSAFFTNESRSWGLSIPLSLYLKFALELHSHLGICIGVGLPSLVYWGATRGTLDQYWETVFIFNVEITKTSIFNLVIGLLHFLVHRIIKWVKDHKTKQKGSSSEITSKLELPCFYDRFYAVLMPDSLKDVILRMLEMLSAFYCNGNVLLLSWCLSGQAYSYEVGKGISWVSLGSSMFVWTKALLNQLEMPPQPQGPITEEKAYKMEKDQHFSIQSMEGNDVSKC